ncbi:MAG: sigma-70 family RNA polymerase sigma factor [Oscillospiraceae bacterium]|nr:sigma-70 family RNA polymerase sigma factor [Oscillospiraceae bacterium]
MYSGTGTVSDEYIRYILETYSAQIIRLCYTYVKNKEDAEDIAQDVFLELMRRNQQFEDAEYEKAWLMRTAVNKCKNLLKSSRVKRTVPLEDEYTDNDSNPENQKEDNAVRDAVLALPEKYRTVVHLFYFSEMSIKEIAVVTGVNTATVGTRLARGREQLKKILKGEIDL